MTRAHTMDGSFGISNNDIHGNPLTVTEPADASQPGAPKAGASKKAPNPPSKQALLPRQTTPPPSRTPTQLAGRTPLPQTPPFEDPTMNPPSRAQNPQPSLPERAITPPTPLRTSDLAHLLDPVVTQNKNRLPQQVPNRRLHQVLSPPGTPPKKPLNWQTEPRPSSPQERLPPRPQNAQSGPRKYVPPAAKPAPPPKKSAEEDDKPKIYGAAETAGRFEDAAETS